MSGKHKNILCVSVMQSWGGGEEFLLNLAENVRDYNFVFASPEGTPLNTFQQRGLKVIKVNSLKKFYRKESSWSFAAVVKIFTNSIISAIKLISLILRYKIDLILANGNFAGLYCIPIKIFTRKNLIVIQHLIYKENSSEKRILKLLYRYSDRLVCISLSVSENLESMIGKDSGKKVAVIYHGMKFPKLNNNYNGNAGNERINIGIIGSIIRLKAIDEVINALKEIMRRNTKVHLNIFGKIREDEPDSIKYEKELRQQIVDLNLNENVHFRGFEKSKEKIYENLDIVINYSNISESFSFTVLEALSFGKIVIASDIGGPREIIDNNKTGYLVKPFDKKALSEIIKYCIDNFSSSEVNEIRTNARKAIETKFSMEKFSNAYNNLFDSILSN